MMIFEMVDDVRQSTNLTSIVLADSIQISMKHTREDFNIIVRL